MPHMRLNRAKRGAEDGGVAHLEAILHVSVNEYLSDDNGTVQSLVAAGVGCALVPLLVLNPHDENVALLRFGDGLSPRIIALAWHRDRYRSPAARAFVETARRIGAELVRAIL